MSRWKKYFYFIGAIVCSVLSKPSIAQTIVSLDSMQKKVIVLKHNQYRQQVGAAPISWNDSIAKIAQSWALQLAASGKLEHNYSNALGENLYWNSHNYADSSCLINAVPVTRWASEKANFKGVTFKQSLLKYGHYTQLIWPTTTQVGCGAAFSENGFYVVCNYSPAGNTLGQVIDP